MLSVLKLTLTLCIPFASSVTVEIDGIIDLGPKWNYAYSLKPRIVKSETFKLISAVPTAKPEPIEIWRQRKEPTGNANKDVKRDSLWRQRKEPTSNGNKDVTIMEETTDSKIFKKSHIVRDDKDINEFAFHVYKQSLKVFDMIKKKVDPQMWPKVDFITRSYDEKFRAFVEDTMNQNIKTSLGTQKVVLNTIDTSNRLMKRLVNYFLGELSRDGSLRTQLNVANVLQREVEKETNLEYSHVCTKFSICRTARGFDNFMVDVFTTLIKCNDAKIKQASDSITETLKTTDFSNVMTKPTHEKFLRKIADAESWDAFMTRAVFTIMKNLFALKNQPLKVMMHGTEHIKSTVVLLEIIDELDKTMQPNEENLLTWTDILSSLNQWHDGKRDDVQEIIQNLVFHVNENGFNVMSKERQENIKKKFTLIFN